MADSALPKTLLPLNKMRRLCYGVVVEGINLVLSELASRDPSSEEDIKLLISAALGFGETEIGPDSHQEASATPNEAGVALEVPFGGVHKVRLENARNDTSDGV